MDTTLVGLIGGLIGLLLSNLIAILIERHRRHERMLDILTAIHAEILAGDWAVEMQTDPDEEAYAIDNELPFGPADESDFVFDSIKADLSILPIEVIHEIVRYYKLAAQSNLYTNDLKHPLFREQKPDEKRKYVRNLMGLMEEQAIAARLALDAIERFGESYQLGLKSKRDRVARKISHERSNRSDHA